ncbi:hypothetical protein [Niveispirillum sp. KHB5.9]|uniref:hypothetical protein n=1 Tax=Niveispirillum sp. KHB5.9 TaxID=3400269 RepID=UPI003A89C58D
MMKEPRGGDTPVRRLHQKLIDLSCPLPGLSEDARVERNQQQAVTVTALAQMPAVGPADVWRKVAVVGDRLRTEGHARSSAFGALTLMLLDSACDDLAAMAAYSASAGDRRGQETI